MKCKVCNHELIPGSRQCPHCGAAVPDEKDTFVSEFKWNIQDYPKPKNQQKQNISIDWKSGRILDENSGKIYDQSLNEWAEPEEIRDLFTFDTRNERRQQTLDREMDRIFKGSGKSSIPHSDTPPVHREKDDDTFHLPSSMKRDFSDDLTEMHRDLFSGLFRDNPDDKKDNSHSGTGESEPGSILSREKEDTEHSSQRKETKKEDSALHDKIDFHEHSDEEKTPEKPSAPESSDNLVDDFIRALHNISGDIYGGQHRKHTSSHQREDGKRTDSDAASSEKSSGSPPASASEGKDIPEKKAETEKKTSESPETRLSPETSEPRDDASSSRKPETEKPESEKKDHIPESDSEFSGFSRLIEAEKRFKDDMEKVTFLTPAEYEEAEKAETKSEKLRFVPTISFRTIEDEYEAYRRENENAPQKPSDEEKGVQISINEPSGTKVTVKTQEISLASLNDDPKVKTREVRLDDVKQSPKNVQVSVEVNAAQGNASVEVTRRHDGATVVKTVDKSDAGHIYIDGEDKTDYSEGTADRSRTVPVSAPEKTEKAEDFSVEDAIRSGEKKESVAPETIADADSVLDDLDEKLTDDTAVEPETEETAETNKENEEKDTEQPADEDAYDAKEEGSDEDDGKNIVNETGSGDERTSAVTPDAVADGSASSEAAQQTMQIPALEAKELAAALAERKAAQEAGRRMYENGQENQDVPEKFWEKPSGVSKMTITDIFGPEARKIMEEGRKKPSDGSAKHTGNSSKTAETSPEDSSILNIQPEDIAPSQSQTESIYIPATDPDTGRRGVTTETISRERQAEMQEALDAIDSIKEEERREKEKAEKKAEKERAKMERNRLKAEKKARKKAARENAKAAAAEKSADSGDENEGLSPAARILIIVLSVLLIIEFTIIGIKLFAPDSGAATLIQRVETQVTGIFSADDSRVSSLSGNGGITGTASEVKGSSDPYTAAR